MVHKDVPRDCVHLCLLSLDTWEWRVTGIVDLASQCGTDLCYPWDSGVLGDSVVVIGCSQPWAYHIPTACVYLLPSCPVYITHGAHRYKDPDSDTMFFYSTGGQTPLVCLTLTDNASGKPHTYTWTHLPSAPPPQCGLWHNHLQIGRTLVACHPSIPILSLCDTVSGCLVAASEGGAQVVWKDRWGRMGKSSTPGGGSTECICKTGDTEEGSSTGEEPDHSSEDPDTDTTNEWSDTFGDTNSEEEDEPEPNFGDGHLCLMGSERLTVLQVYGPCNDRARLYHLGPDVGYNVLGCAFSDDGF
ncbi:hypothetical protein KIPB_007949 [Kipferlia bialata]|uniref:Uncharacterized protein n=1 Tax=Kipferlia bialata TaxID=797122 RepID=A0A9K3D100_9EUKA|nr:hypothetical protein KIPB_007949 [Kipferlia bialata]|eukprot:g7949.t1